MDSRFAFSCDFSHFEDLRRGQNIEMTGDRVNEKEILLCAGSKTYTLKNKHTGEINYISLLQYLFAASLEVESVYLIKFNVLWCLNKLPIMVFWGVLGVLLVCVWVTMPQKCADWCNLGHIQKHSRNKQRRWLSEKLKGCEAAASISGSSNACNWLASQQGLKIRLCNRQLIHTVHSKQTETI